MTWFAREWKGGTVTRCCVTVCLFARRAHGHATARDRATRQTAPRAARPGFTLLEVVLAVTLALALMVAMLTFYKQVADVRVAVIEESELVGQERLVMDRLTQELRAGYVYPMIGLGLEGDLTQMRFATVTLPGGSAWIVQKATETDAMPPERDLQLLGYRLRIVEDEDGQPVIEGVERTCQKTLTARTTDEEEEIPSTLMAPSLKFIRLRYWDGGAWVDAWSSGDLPQAVEIVLGKEPLPEGVEPLEYPYEIYRRVVFIPSAARAAQGGTVVRGLGEGGQP